MKRGKMITEPQIRKYTERYKGHPVLSHDILDEETEKDFFKNIRLKMREVRKELKMTQREFGETAGIDRRYVAKVECGSQNPSFKFIRSISIKHKISMDWLLYGIGQKYVETDAQSYGPELFAFKKLLDNGTEEDIEVMMKMVKKILK
jgi:transcriptional regulator with XRE-family HTH domain